MTHRFVPVATVVLALLVVVPGVCLAAEYEEERAEVLAVLAALESNEEGLSESERLERYVDVLFDHTMNEYPELATYLGLPRGQDRWSDNSLAGEERRERDMLRALALLESFDRSALAADERLDYDLLLDQLRSAKEGMRFPGELLAINQMDGVHSQVAQVVAVAPARNVGDYENLVARLEKVPTLIDNTVERLELGLEQGVTPPRVTLRDLPQQVRNLVVEDPLASPLLAAFTRFPDAVSAADRERLTAAAAATYRDGIAPAFTRLADFLEATYVPGARETIAMKDLPEGEAWYAYRVREMTTTEMGPQQVHDIGLAEVARIRAEMDRVIAASGFEGSFEEFTEFLRTDPRFYFASGEELLAAYRDIAKRADAALPKLFGTLPRLPYGIQAVPEFKEKSSTTAYYEPGSIDAGRAGYFFATPTPSTSGLPGRWRR